MKSDFKFKEDFNLEQRREEANRILKEYNNSRMPIICEKAPKSKLAPLRKTKYLAPSDMTIGQFQFIIRRNLDLNENYALYLMTQKGISLIGDKTLMEIYNIHKDKQDNFLYIYYDSELTWG